jgi:hypothetical protein
MTEDQRGSWLVGRMQVGIRPTMRRVDFEDRHAGNARSLDPFVSLNL